MAITDYFTSTTNGSRPQTTTLSAQKIVAAASLSTNGLSGWNTGTVHFILYRIDTAGAKVAGSQTDWKGIVSGSTITNLTLKAGTDTIYDADGRSVLECSPTAAWADDVMDGILTHADQDGTLKAGAVDNAAVLADGVVTSAKILDGTIATGDIANATITSSKLSLSPQTAFVATSETTSATSYADLTTTTDTVTITVGSNGLAYVSFGARLSNSVASNNTLVSVAISGATTTAASDDWSLLHQNDRPSVLTQTKLFTGLTPGSTTFKLKYRVTGGVGTYVNRHIEVIPL